MPNYVEILRLFEAGFSQRKIAKLVSSGRNTVSRTLKIAHEKELTYEEISQWPIEKIDALFKPSGRNQSQVMSYYVMPNYEVLAKELAKPGVTMQLLWEEYVQECRVNNKIFYKLTQFKKHFNEYLAKNSFSHVIRHKAGEIAQVDWAGKRPCWKDPMTGEIIQGSLFVGTLPFSGYTFARACIDQKMPQWIESHIQMYEYFQGIPTMTVPDNLKTGVVKNTKKELILNATYEDMANHYQTIIVPTRVAHPKDKAAVENHVKHLTTFIIARMRHYQCFSIEEYNDYLLQFLNDFNAKPFQKKEGSRFQLFNQIEQETLKPLPSYPYEVCEFKEAKVYKNSHITLNKHYYSVPHQYIGEKVTLKVYSKAVKIYHNGTLLCTHETTDSQPGGYTTNKEHLPENYQPFSYWDKNRYLDWARRVGPNVHSLISNLLDQETEQKAYKKAHKILKMADLYSDQRLDHACHLALERSSQPHLNLIKQILESPTMQSDFSTSEQEEQSYLRGADYYEQFNRKN